MKPLVIKGLLVGSLILFFSVLLILLIGCIACALGAEQKIFCGTLSCVGTIALGVTFLGTAIYVIRSLFIHR
jgi:hypothetical protein